MITINLLAIKNLFRNLSANANADGLISTAERNKNGLLEGMPGDWIFIDWADGLSKEGEVVLSNCCFAEAWKPWLYVPNWLMMQEGAANYGKQATSIKKQNI